MLSAQQVYGPHDQNVRTFGEAAFGRALYRLLPEDSFDRQPLVGGDGRFLLAADLRIDNRAELAAAFGGLPDPLSHTSDSALALRCFERWGPGLFDRIAGDFAIAIWDREARTLLLARDPLGQRPLHYRSDKERFAFSSMPSGILALDSRRPSPDGERIAEFLSDMRPSLGRSMFAGVSSVKPGHVLTWAAGRLSETRYWNPQPAELRLPSFADYVEAFREQVDTAVRSRLRGAGDVVASHLSSGYDSSTVAATAAMLTVPSGGRVVAFTAAPRLGFRGAPAHGRIADESGIAAVTAARHPNIDHVVLRSDQTDPIGAAVDMIPYAQQPLGNIKNAGWWMRINAAAAERGASVLLTGENGNMTLSAGNLMQLADLVRKGQWLRWSREARASKRNQGLRWRGILAASWGPWVPEAIWKRIVAATAMESERAGTGFLLAPAWRARMAERSAADTWSIRPPSDSRAVRLALLGRQSHGNSRKAALARWGVDERDPTSDRRLIEFCLSLPADMLLKDGVRRPLARAALADRLPAEVLDGHTRGYQSADWYEQITRERVEGLFEVVRRSPEAAAIIDMEEIGRMIENWPERDWHLPSVFVDYWTMLNALSSAYFISLAAEGRAMPNAQSFGEC